jgi:hypothetical protein
MTAERFHSRATSRHGLRRRAATQSESDRAAPGEPAAAQVSALQVLIALLVAPLAWLAQVSIADMVLGQRCGLGGPVFVVHTMSWTPFTVVAASLVCLIFAAFGTFVAWRNLWRTARIPWRFPPVLKGTRDERDWLLSRICAMSSTMFILGLLATDVAILAIAPCSPW